MKRVLFVCVENSCRSQIAEAFGNMHGQEIIKAYSCGSKPSGKVNPKAIKSMRKVDYDLSVHHSKSIDEIPDFEYDFLITMGCGDQCPNLRARKKLEWEIPDPKKMKADDFANIRDLICKEVKNLIASD